MKGNEEVCLHSTFTLCYIMANTTLLCAVKAACKLRSVHTHAGHTQKFHLGGGSDHRATKNLCLILKLCYKFHVSVTVISHGLHLRMYDIYM